MSFIKMWEILNFTLNFSVAFAEDSGYGLLQSFSQLITPQTMLQCQVLVNNEK